MNDTLKNILVMVLIYLAFVVVGVLSHIIFKASIMSIVIGLIGIPVLALVIYIIAYIKYK